MDGSSGLIVSGSQKAADFFTRVMGNICRSLVTVTSCQAARRLLLERDFDIVIINAPLCDETGEELSRHIAAKGISQVILAVPAEYSEQIRQQTEDIGVITLSKPVAADNLWMALKLARAAQNRLKIDRKTDGNQVQRIQDIRIIDRAKRMLITRLNMSENEAHKYIERQAMDLRITKRAVAEGILRTYES